MSSPEQNKRTALIIGGIALAVLVIAGLWWFMGRTTVPNVTGLSEQEALVALEGAGLSAGEKTVEATLSAAPGTVLSQTPAADESVARETAVDLVVAAAPTVVVPDVVGTGSAEAEAQLAESGLIVGSVTAEYTDDAPAGEVIAQSPESGTEVRVASAVALQVSAGPTQGAVPNVVGLSSSDAVATLESAGFKVTQKKQSSESVASGDVLAQTPTAGTVATEGSTVTITVSTGAPAPAPAPAEPAAPEPAPPTDGGTEPEVPPATETPERPGAGPSLAEVPDFVGMGPLEAFLAARKANLQVAIEWGPSEDAILKVIEQDPAAGADVDQGTVVTITIGMPSFLFEGVSIQPLPAEPEGEVEQPIAPAPEADESSAPAQ